MNESSVRECNRPQFTRFANQPSTVVGTAALTAVAPSEDPDLRFFADYYLNSRYLV